MDVGVAVRVHVGGIGVAMTVTVCVHCAVCPSAFVTVSTYVVSTFGDTVRVPFTRTAPIPWLRDAEIALEEVHENVDEPPLLMVAATGVIAQVGGFGGVVVTATVCVQIVERPSAAVTVRWYVVVMIGLTTCDPLIGTTPTPPSIDAETAFDEVHESVALPPGTIDTGVAVSAHVGIGGGVITCTDCEHVAVCPVALMTVIVYVVFEVGLTILEPLSNTRPIPWLRDAEMLFVDVHESVALPPWLIIAGVAVMVHVGALGGTTVTTCVHVAVCPELFVTVNVYVVFVDGDTVCAPFIITAPIPWLSVAETALDDVHEKVDEPPLFMVAFAGVRVHVGAFGGGVTVTVLVHDTATPALFTALSVYVVVRVMVSVYVSFG